MNLRFLSEKNPFKNAVLWFITESWLSDDILDDSVGLDGFRLFHADRTSNSGKQRGGGIVIYVKTDWCSNFKVVTQICTPNIEILALQCRPYYLPREFTCIVVVAVYCAPSADIREARTALVGVIESLEQKHPDAAIIVGGGL